MAETAELIRLAVATLARGEELLMATVVRVEGSSYRKPGARMLLTSGGGRAGTISGGCLEAEVAKKAWWLTANGPSLHRYSSFFDDDGVMPYGLGCGGTVWVLLERGAGARAAIEALQRVQLLREAATLVTSLGEQPRLREVRTSNGEQVYVAGAAVPGNLFAFPSDQARSGIGISTDDYFVEHLLPPPALFLFGAGDDAQPVVKLAHSLGWHVVVADGRAHLARAERFPLAAEVRVIDYGRNILGDGPEPGPSDMVVLLTHSYEQDLALLGELLPRPLRYLGVLGPQRRTDRLITELLPRLSETGKARQEWMKRVRTPVGLDLGGDDPSAIALSIVAELQAVLHGRVISTKRESGRGVPPVVAAVEALGD
jgi:xanthine dehydrogenase accessory factor